LQPAAEAVEVGKLILASPNIRVAPDAREDGGEEEEELMRQALMSTETEAVLSGLPVRELRARLQARGIPTVGLVEKAGPVRRPRWSMRSASHPHL